MFLLGQRLKLFTSHVHNIFCYYFLDFFSLFPLLVLRDEGILLAYPYSLK